MTMLEPAGLEAHTIAGVAWSLFVGSALIFAGVMALLVVSLRRRAGKVSTRWWVVGGGLVFPGVVLTVLMGYTAVRSAQLTRAPPAHALIVSVAGKMWWWEVRYRNAEGPDVVLANEIHIPVGRPVVLGLSSTDVIHSFWVPQLGGKMDMVPGRTNQLVLQATAPGTYRGQCAEYCGEQHARMALHVVAHTPEDFDAWLAAQAQPARAPSTALAERGRAAFAAQRCTACHTVRGVSEEGRLGPDLTHVGSRLFLGAGTLRNDAAAMQRWIAHVQAVKPGARMPSFGQRDAADLEAMAAYLEQLK
ncbi:MAG: cytochrome c oxidase subunit II [Comamonadaceae bacterium]|nr:MAG: cytochrome c oxidase subunit II [Comamonadaceae bacterium]